MPKSDAERQKLARKNKKKAGLIWIGLWIKPSWKKAIKDFIETLKDKER